MEFILIPLMILLAGYAGGSLPGSQHLDKLHITWLPEALFSGLVALPALFLPGWWKALYLLAFVVSYGGMQSATGVILPWRDTGERNPDKDYTLKPVWEWINKAFDFPFDSVGYATIAASVKGFITTLPVGGLGAIYWPLSYEIGYWLNHNKYSEICTGFFAGCNLYAIILILKHYGLSWTS